jgi:phytoene synthase
MSALYSFLRITDDLGDAPGDMAQKTQALADWRIRLTGAFDGNYTHRLHAALHRTLIDFAIPPDYLFAVIDGVEMDLAGARYATFSDLYRYCYRVASVVGLACIHIWGFRDAMAKKYAELAGIAFQLTNILRDLKEDSANGRIYLPQEDLERWGYSVESLGRGERNENFRELMRFQVARTRDYYEAAQPLTTLLAPPGRAVFMVMSRTYRGLLETIVSRDFDVFTRRIRLSSWHKILLTARALPVRCGWR